MLKNFDILLLFNACAIVVLVQTCDVNAAEADDVALWLARSCVGEAGWDAHRTGECAFLMHIYLKQSAKGQMSLYEAARKYSGATKKRRNHPRKWLFELNRSDVKPPTFPKHLNWVVYRDDWLATLDLAESFLNGSVYDPIPQAVHYGSIYDHHRAVKAGWWEIQTPFRNRAYSVNKPHGLNAWKAK